MNHLAQTPPPFLSEGEIDVLKRTLLQGFTEDEQESFVRQCQRTLLDPFSKQIYATRRWVKDRQGNKVPTLVPITSAIGLTAIAVRTGHYDGCVTQWAGTDGIWKDEWLSEEYPVAAKCVVYHKQRSHPEVGIAQWSGYCGQAFNKDTKRWEVTEFWERLGAFMLGKVAKAQALRGAFPDQCSNLYITEELQGGISEADQLDDEAKISDNRRREAELRASPPKGATFVQAKPTAPVSAAQAAEPAFDEDRLPSNFTPSGPAKPVAQPSATPAPDEANDDLDMSPAEPETEPTQPDESADSPAGTTAWKDHLILGLKNDKFYNRRVGDLKPAELAAIEASWIPKVRKVWGEVNPLQKADCEAFEAAIQYYRMEKPWP